MKLEISMNLTRAAAIGADRLSYEVGLALGKIAKTIDDAGLPAIYVFDKYQNITDLNGDIIGTWRLK